MNDPTPLDTLLPLLERIAAPLERAAPPTRAPVDLGAADAFLWGPERRLIPVPRVNRVEMGLLTGIDRARDTLAENTERFAKGLPANNALLWGARRTGKAPPDKAGRAGVDGNRPQGGLAMKRGESTREDIAARAERMANPRG